jgi:8-amino-7-oxononanoate synthase
LTEPFYQRLQDNLLRRKNENLFRELRLNSGGLCDLSSNDYFNLRMDPRVIAGSQSAMQQYGAGSGASPLLSGYLPCHESLINGLKQWKGKSAGLLFNTGFMANQAVLKHLPGKDDLILADRLIHHSIAQTLATSSVKFKRYRHLDLGHLEKLLSQHHSSYETVFVVTESVFSMDGDYPDLQQLVKLKKQYPFILILDEAHGTGVYGPRGEGLAGEMQVSGEIDILVGTLGKSLASMGAYVLSQSQLVVDTLVNQAGELIYSTYLAPAQAGAAESAMHILQNSSKERSDLRFLAKRFRHNLIEAGWTTAGTDSPIIPILMKDADSAIQVRNIFHDKGILVSAVRPPTVPKGTSRLRLSLHSGLDWGTCQEVMEILKRCENHKA